MTLRINTDLLIRDRCVASLTFRVNAILVGTVPLQVGNLRNIYHFMLPEKEYSTRNLGSIDGPINDLTRSLKREDGVSIHVYV